MGPANSFTRYRTGGVVLATCISILLAVGTTRGDEVKEKKKESNAKQPQPHFASERPKLRPLFGKPYEEGVENNKFNDGGETTVSPHTLKSPRGTTGSGFDPDPGGVTPPIFNPDPGAENPANAQQPAPTGPSALMGGTAPEDQPLEGRQKLPRANVRGQVPVRRTWEYPEYYEDTPLLGKIKGGGYVRDGMRDRFPAHSVGIPNRWEITVPHWQRYMDPSTEAPYMYDTPRWWHPYEQSRLKGDVPIIGQDIFLNLTAKNFSLFEMRKLPTPSGVSTALPNSSEFFGRSQQLFFSNDTSLAIDLFEGETAFKPVHWLIRMLGVYNTNWIRVRENNAIDPDPRGTTFNDHKGAKDTSKIQAIRPDGESYSPEGGFPDPFTTIINPADVFNYLREDLNPQGDANYLQEVDKNGNIIGKARKGKGGHELDGHYTTRRRDFFALQEAFAELHISDLSENYDFVSSRWGIQPFVSDFRGFIYADTNLGVRLFGNWDNNRIQYNLAYFNQREKDTYSDLNTFESRHQQILIANVFRQDLIWKGYTGELSFLANFDDGGTHYDKNGFLTRPSILGTVPPGFNVNGADGTLGDDQMRAFYLGWTGDGHIGRWNITHALYWAFGEDKFNPFTGRRADRQTSSIAG